MAAYIIADIQEITDQTAFQAYAGEAGATIPKYDGRPRVVRASWKSSRARGSR